MGINQHSGGVPQNDEQFRLIFESAAVGLARVSLDGHWLDVNGCLCEVVGYSRDELLVRRYRELTHPSDLDRELAGLRQLLDGECPTYSMERRCIRKDGDLVWLECIVSVASLGSHLPASALTPRQRAPGYLERGQGSPAHVAV